MKQKKELESSHLLGEFLWKNRVISAGHLARAIQYQKTINHHLGIMRVAESLLREDELALVHARLSIHEETFEEAISGLGLLSPEELVEMREAKHDFRIPLGLILQRQKAVSPEKFRLWLKRFENQSFNRRQLKSQLKGIPLFAPLKAADLNRIVGLLKYKYFTAGEYVYRFRDRSDGIYIVESGLVRRTVEMKAEQRIIGSCQKDDAFGLAGALSDTPREESARAIMDTVLWRLSAADFRRLFAGNARLAGQIAHHLSENYQSTLGRIKTRGLVNDSRVSVVLMDAGGEARTRTLKNLVSSLQDNLPGKALIVTTLSGAKPAGMKGRPANLGQTRPTPTGRGGIEFLYLKGIENARSFDHLARWLRAQVERYDSIIFLTAPGNRDYRRFIMGLCRRSVTLIHEEIPEWIRYLRPGRDRLYQLETNGRQFDLAHHGLLLDDCPGVFVPGLVRADHSVAAMDRVARWLSGRSVGVAFGGGGARGLAHMGVLEILEMIGMPIDMVTGTSAGAHVAGMYSIGRDAAAMVEYITEHAIKKRGHPFNDLTLPFRSVIRGRKYRNLLERAFGDTHMADALLPFLPVCTDLRTGKPTVVNDLLMCDAVLASGSVPGVFPPFKAGERVLGDGGMVNNLPASVLKAWQTDFVLCVNVSIDPARSSFDPNSFGTIVQQALDIFMDQSIRDHLEYTDFEIKPEVHEFSVTDHRRGEDIIERGREAARRVLPQLVRTLRKKGIPLKPGRFRPG